MSTLTIIIASDNIAFLGAVKMTDPDSNMTLSQIESVAVVYDSNDEDLTASAIFRTNAASFEAQMKTTVANLIDGLNRPNYELSRKTVRGYEEKAVAKVAEYAEMVKGKDDRWLTVVFNAEGELVDAYADNDRTLMAGQSNSTLVVRPADEIDEVSEEEKEMERLNSELVSNFGWTRESYSINEVGNIVADLEEQIEWEANENLKAHRTGDKEQYNPPLLIISSKAYRALIDAGISLDGDNYAYTYIMNDWATSSIYVTDRDAVWVRDEIDWDNALPDFMKKYENFIVFDDGSSMIVPLLLPGNQYKIIDIEGWVDTAPSVIDYFIPVDCFDEAPF